MQSKVKGDHSFQSVLSRQSHETRVNDKSKLYNMKMKESWLLCCHYKINIYIYICTYKCVCICTCKQPIIHNNSQYVSTCWLISPFQDHHCQNMISPLQFWQGQSKEIEEKFCLGFPHLRGRRGFQQELSFKEVIKHTLVQLTQSCVLVS